MAEFSMFFDPVQDESGQYDREYNAAEFTKYFAVLITTGVIRKFLNELKVTANGSNMVTTVDTGVAFINARYYENTELLELTHDTESLGLNRIDRVVLRLNLNTEARNIKAFIKKGTPSTNPQPPALTRNLDIYEISLAQVKIIGGQTYINAADIIDERENTDVCGWAKSKILPDVSTALQEHLDAVLPHVFTDGGKKYNYGWKVENGILKFKYEEADD